MSQGDRDHGGAVDPSEATAPAPAADGEATRIDVDEVLPRTIGRYELVHELGRGGMARVYLARMGGLGGFFKWIAVKTIHKYLSADPRIVGMFLDEARIAASIQHPNVVQILDVGQDQGELFIAMEYLHGENLKVVELAAKAKIETLPLEVAAHIVAETARGLHHAHEALDATGQPLALVHRDVSPHNVIVAYDGQVKLTDFGVAKAAGRINMSMSGHVKGKWAYMSPEQVMGEPIDRRSDIFSLGVVLWEITTGLRLFKAESEVRTVMRITSGKVTEPSSVVPGYPEKLERIALRALSRRPMDRYPTAAAMAEELDEFVALIGRPVTSDDLARLMRQLFAEGIEGKEALLRREAAKALGTGSRTAAPPVVAPAPALAPAPEPTASAIELPRRRPVLLVLAAVVATFVLGLVATLLAMGERDAVVRVATEPAGATVRLDGVPQPGATPAELLRVRAGSHQLELSLEGFETRRVTFDAAGRVVELRYELRRAAVVAPPPSVAPVTPAPDAGPVAPVTPAPDAGAAAPPPETPDAGGAHGPTPPPDRPRARETAYLNLIARPSARVWINGRPAGQTPLVRVPIPAGWVVVRLEPEGAGVARTLRFHAAPGETISRPPVVLTQ